VADLAPLANLAGRIRQRTPTRALRSRPDRIRHRRVRSVAWKSVDARTVELEVRTEAGLYVKELVSGDAGRTRPSVAEVLGVAAECIELDVIAIHI
jgi:tRNA pseudouridine synthase 10